MSNESSNSNRQRVRRFQLGHEPSEDLRGHTTAAKRIGMVWQLTINAWAFRGIDVAGTRMRRDMVCVIRPSETDSQRGQV